MGKTKKRIVVIGGGFAGLQFIRHLDTDLFDVMLIDKLNHHQFQPLFYQVATSQLEPSSISFPFRKIFQHKKNVAIRLAEVTEVVTTDRIVKTSIGNFTYDILVLASGCRSNFFGNNEIRKHALTLKSTYDAITIRNHILENFESLFSISESERASLLNIVIVGAGPTGVELAGAFAEIKKHILPKDYPGIDFSRLNIYLIEGSKYPLGSMSKNAQDASFKYLTQMGVILETEVVVKSYDGQQVLLSNGKLLPCKNFIWAAGVTGNLISGLDQKVISRGNRILVDRFNKVVEYDDVYALGDIACMHTPKYPDGHPQLANVAIYQAHTLARNLKAMSRQQPLREFEYSNRGTMATIGKHKAVVDLPFFRFKGYFAWFVWMFLHLMFILSVKNKLIIFINWAWNYFTKDSSLRLILSKQKDP